MTSDYVEDGLSRDWTIFRGSPSLCGYAECVIPASPQLLWSRTVQSRTVAAPIVYDGMVYTLDRKGRLRRFSPEGDSVLVHDFKTAIEASFVADDSILYVGRIAAKEANAKIDELRVADALSAVMSIFKRLNKYIDETEPWVLAKEEEKADRLSTVLYNLIEGINIGASLLRPFMPETSDKILTQINADFRSFDDMEEFGQYESGKKVTDEPEILFARMKMDELIEMVEGDLE